MDMIAMLAGFGGPLDQSSTATAYTGTTGGGSTSGGRVPWSTGTYTGNTGGKSTSSGSSSVTVPPLPTPPAAVPSLEQYFRLRGLDFNQYNAAAERYKNGKTPDTYKKTVLDKVLPYLASSNFDGVVGAWANFMSWPETAIISFEELQLATELVDSFVTDKLSFSDPKRLKDIRDRRSSYYSTGSNNPLSQIIPNDVFKAYKRLFGQYSAFPNRTQLIRNALTAATAALVSGKTETYASATYSPDEAARDMAALVILATVFPPEKRFRAIDGIAWGRWWAETGRDLGVYQSVISIRNGDVKAYKAAQTKYNNDLAAWKEANRRESEAAAKRAKDEADKEANRKIKSARYERERRVAEAEAEAKKQAADAEKARKDAETARIAMQAALDALQQAGSTADVAALNATIEQLKQDLVNAQNAAAEAARRANETTTTSGGDTTGAAGVATDAAADATQTAADALQQAGEEVVIKPKEKKGGGVMLLVVGAVAVGGYMWWKRRQLRQIGP